MRLAFSAALAAALGVTVYAAVNLHLLSFPSGTRYVTMRTNQAMTEQEAQALVQDDLRERSDAPNGNSAVLPPQQSFQSVKEAEAAMDMTLILPSAMPEMKLDSIEGQSFYNEAGYQNNTVRIVCSDPGGRMLGVTTKREVIPEGTPLTSYTLHEFDEGSEGSYRSKSGITFTTLAESDSTGERTAQIATVLLGEYMSTRLSLWALSRRNGRRSWTAPISPPIRTEAMQEALAQKHQNPLHHKDQARCKKAGRL